MNNMNIIHNRYRYLVPTYVQYVKRLQSDSYVNRCSLQLFHYQYRTWAKKQSGGGANNKTKFLAYMLDQAPHIPVIPITKPSSTETLKYAISLVLKLHAKVLTFRANPIKIHRIINKYRQIIKHYHLKYGKIEDQTWRYLADEQIDQPIKYRDHWWQNLQPGDIIYERNGFYRLIGHIGVVDGIYYDSFKQQFFIKWLQCSWPYGVQGSIYDDQSFKHRDSIVLRMPNITNDETFRVLNFIKDRIAHDFGRQIKRIENKKKWYCSDLVWAAFKSVGIDILDRRGDLSKIHNTRDAVNMGYKMMFKSQKFDLPRTIGALDLLLISLGGILPHELFESRKFIKALNF